MANKPCPPNKPDHRSTGLERRIHGLEQKMKILDAALDSPGEWTLNIQDPGDIWKEREKVQEELDILYEQWLEAEESS